MTLGDASIHPAMRAAVVLGTLAANARQVNPAQEALARRVMTAHARQAADLLARSARPDDPVAASAHDACTACAELLVTLVQEGPLWQAGPVADGLSRATQWLRMPGREALSVHVLRTSPTHCRELSALLDERGWTAVRAAAVHSLQAVLDLDARTAPDTVAVPGALQAVQSSGVHVADQGRAWAGGHVEAVLAWLGPLSASQAATAQVLATDWTGTLGDLHRVATSV